MLSIFSWRLVVLCLLLYLFSSLTTGVIITLTGESALPVSVIINGSERKNLINADVYRISINGSQRPLTIKTYIGNNSIVVKDGLLRSYFQAIQVKLSDQQMNTLTSLTIKIGDDRFTFSRQELLNRWQLVRKSPHQCLYQSPAYVSAPRSTIPFWRKIINWDFSWNLIWDIFIHKLALLIVIIVFLVSLTRPGQKLINHFQLWSVQKDNRLLYISGAFSILITLYRMPYIAWPIESGLDPSWVVGLNWAYTKGLQWGQDIVFTYGPYYWLLYPNLLLTSPTLPISLIVTTIVFLCALGIFIYYILCQVKRQNISAPVALLAILVLAFFEYTLNDITVVTSVLLVTNKQRSYFANIFPACLFLALLSLCKFSYLAVSLCIVVFYSGQCLIKKRYTELMLCSFTYICALYGLWVLNGQSTANLWIFINRGYEVAQGYSEAMATPLWNESQSFFGNVATNMMLAAVGGALLLGIIILFLTSLKPNGIWYELLLTAPILFLAFKEGFIRMDLSHAVLFFAQLQLVLLAYLIFYKKASEVPNYVRIILINSFIVLLIFTNGHVPIGYNSELVGVFSVDKREKLLVSSRNHLKTIYPLNQDIRKNIGSNSIDIIPYDISMLYGYGFNWSPRPVFQSYSVHSAILDSLNSLHYNKVNAPNNLLFSFKSIDNHHPLFDEPILLRTLISQYEVIGNTENNLLLLRRKSQPLIIDQTISHTQPVTHHFMNAAIYIPVRQGFYTYLHANIELTLLGKLLNFLFKIQPLFIDVKLKDSNHLQRFRVIRQTAKDGLLVSSFAENLQTTSNILSGSVHPNVKSVKFVGNTWLYNSDIRTVFRFEAYHQ